MTIPTLLRKLIHAAPLCACFTLVAVAADPALTIYNQDFAVVRETLPMDLNAGSNTIRFSGATARLEPDSVILRDPTGQRALVILEQNYRADPVSQELLLNLYEGKTIDFVVHLQDGSTRTVAGRIVRSGYVPHNQGAGAGNGQPIIEVNGKLQFSLPGEPVFPALGDDTILKPALDWIIHSGVAAKFDAELSYITGGMTWNADYNVVAPETGDTLDLVGWVTLDNQSGKQFDHAHIKLMAGEVNKVNPPAAVSGQREACLRCRRIHAGTLRSPSDRSKITICTACRSPPRCMTAKPSRWSSCAGAGSPPNGSMFTMACRSIGTSTTATRMCARCRSTAPNPILTCG